MLEDKDAPVSEETQETTPDPSTAEKPEEPKKRQVTEADIAKLQSVYDRQIASVKKELETERKQREQYETEMERLRSEADLASTYGSDEESKEAARKLQAKELALKQKERDIRQVQRTLNEQLKLGKAAELSREYGIPVDDLLEHNDPRDMELAALRFKVQQQDAGRAKPAADEPKPKPKRPGYDTGEASSRPSSFLTEKDPEKRRAMWDKMKSDAARLRT